KVRLALVDALEADAAPGELADDDFDECLYLELVLGRQFDFVFFENDFGVAALEIEPVRQLLFCLVDRVLDLHQVHLRNDVERWHEADANQTVGRRKEDKIRDIQDVRPLKESFRSNRFAADADSSSYIEQ